MPRTLITDARLRELLGGVSRQFVWEHANDAGFPQAFHVGGLRRYDLDEVTAYIETLRKRGRGRPRGAKNRPKPSIAAPPGAAE